MWGAFNGRARVLYSGSMILLRRLFSSIVIILSLLGTPFAATATALPNQSALVDTYLATGISASATEMTLANGTTRDGAALSGYYCFTVDVNTPTVEYVCGAAVAGAISNLSRGLKPGDPTATSSSLAYSHRRLASVQVTDFPFNQLVQRMLNGINALGGLLYYTSSSTPEILASSTAVLVTKGYVDDRAFSAAGAINATTVAKGLVELATQVEAASSTATGSTGASLTLTADLATSTYNSATAPLRLVMTQNSGKIDNSFISTSTLYSSSGLTIGGASNIASTSLVTFTSSTTPTTTWTKLPNLRSVIVEVQAAGGNGRTGSGSGNVGGGGGGGGYGKKLIMASQLGATETVTVGGPSGAGAGIGGPSSFGSHCTTTGGSIGAAAGGTSKGGAGGTASNCNMNISGSAGDTGTTDDDAGNIRSNVGGTGGSSHLGGGGLAGAADGTGSDGGSNGGGYGGGGGGGAGDGGGTGATGAVFVWEVYY